MRRVTKVGMVMCRLQLMLPIRFSNLRAGWDSLATNVLTTQSFIRSWSMGALCCCWLLADQRILAVPPLFSALLRHRCIMLNHFANRPSVLLNFTSSCYGISMECVWVWKTVGIVIYSYLGVFYFHYVPLQSALVETSSTFTYYVQHWAFQITNHWFRKLDPERTWWLVRRCEQSPPFLQSAKINNSSMWDLFVGLPVWCSLTPRFPICEHDFPPIYSQWELPISAYSCSSFTRLMRLLIFDCPASFYSSLDMRRRTYLYDSTVFECG